jgi:Lanthionine synthetase C-like protein
MGGDGLWDEHPLDHADGYQLRCPLYMGAAGLLWGLHRLGRDHADGFATVLERYRSGSDWPGVEPGYLGGEAGILAAWMAVRPAAEIADRLERVILANRTNETNELLWGAPGTMAAAIALYRRTGDRRWAEAYLAGAEELWLRWLPQDGGIHLWTQQLYGSTSQYVGPGHGFAGNVLVLHMGRDLLDPAMASELDRRAVATATALALRDQDCANWSPLFGGELAAGGTIRVQWCHGAAGMVSSLAGIMPANDGFTELLEAGGELTWRAGPLVKGAGLCHGTAGNGLAFLSLFARTGQERWLERARAFAVHALEQVEREWQQYGTGRHSLWTGDIGAALMAESCIAPRPGLPSLDWI